MTLYSLRTADLDFRITKFDSDLNPESSYLVNPSACECPQGHKPTCRHRRMLPLMLDRVDTAWFYDFDTGLWSDPTGTASSEAVLAGVPEGVTVIGLGDPSLLHETIAEAVGERASPKPWRRL